MADSFIADPVVGQLSVQEANPEARFVMRLEHLSPVRSTGSRHVPNV
ncbi:hypothetical protein [Cupriavidus sp. WS]|nr:hypothetical protein [Cupriavidus sp. WS]